MSMITPSLLRRLAVASAVALGAGLTLQVSPAPAAAPLPSTTRAGATSLVPAAAAPQGRLAVSDAGAPCTRTGTSVSCDLWAKVGSSTISGVTVPIWGFSPTETGTATSPGPTLVVKVGDEVTVTLHNSIPRQSMDLAFPGVPAASFSQGLADAANELGVATGLSESYTFATSSTVAGVVTGHPGTFLYEAGHTADGARQQALGLVGALVVLGADGSAYDSAGTAYDDEAVMVLTEIDPELNRLADPASPADPSTFDMRSYRPQFRLINGNSFPEIPPVATDQGRTVLLRWLNAGSKQHPMTLVGSTQKAVGRDGRPLTYAESEVTAVVEPGMTEDVLVTMPAGPESELTVFESGIHLDNAGQTVGDTLITGFGGMMTTLDTAAPPATGDTVGPVASKVATTDATDVPATVFDGTSDIKVTATVSDAKTGGSSVEQAEIVVDDSTDFTPGSGLLMSQSTDTPGQWLGTLSATPVAPATTSSLDAILSGRHVLYVRGRDSAGNWGVFASVAVTVARKGPVTSGGAATPPVWNLVTDVVVTATADARSAGTGVTVKKAELVVGDDTTPLTTPTIADGSGTPMTTNRTASVVEVTGTIARGATLTEGVHHAWVHSQDSRGVWGDWEDVPFEVDTTLPTATVAIGPASTNGILSSPAFPGYAVVSAQIIDPSGSAGTAGGKVVDAEVFLDTVPVGGFGTGVQMVPSDGTFDSSLEQAYGLIPISAFRTLSEGVHHVYVRAQDAAGNWGKALDGSAPVTVDRTAPVLSALTATTTGVAAGTASVSVRYQDLSPSSTAEYWFGTTDPGAGHATPFSVAMDSANTTAFGSVNLVGAPLGPQTLHVRIVDPAGNWSNTVTTSLTVAAAGLVVEPFASALLAPWTTLGPVAVTGGALRVGSPTASTYLTTAAQANRPLGAKVSTATVDLLVNATGVKREGVTTIFSAASGAGSTVFSLQLQVDGTGKRSVRTVMVKAIGKPANGAWVTMPSSGAATVSLGWRAGPATGATQGRLALTLNSAAAPSSTQTGNTKGLTVSGISVGVVGAPSAPGLKGALLLDDLVVRQ